jgi:hypothetical protein
MFKWFLDAVCNVQGSLLPVVLLVALFLLLLPLPMTGHDVALVDSTTVVQWFTVCFLCQLTRLALCQVHLAHKNVSTRVLPKEIQG